MPQLGKVTGQSVWSDVYLATSDTRTASNEGVLGVIDGVGIPYRPLCVRLSLDQQASTSKTVHACNMSARDITVRRSSAPCASHTPDKKVPSDNPRNILDINRSQKHPKQPKKV